MSGAYYNDNDEFAACWLRELICLGLIAPGDVDNRPIQEVHPNDLKGYTQCHFFAGIGGWSLAARLAGWPDDRPLWSGSCPCQPFSVAGSGRGFDDHRHLWPDFDRLIGARRPPVVVGEQVAGRAGYGWFDGVAASLEARNYACRAVDIPACAVDAPHIRSRLYWVAVQGGLADARGVGQRDENVERSPITWERSRSNFARRGEPNGAMADSIGHSGRPNEQRSRPERRTTFGRDVARGVDHAARIGRGEGWSRAIVLGRRPTTSRADVRVTQCKNYGVCAFPNECEDPNKCCARSLCDKRTEQEWDDAQYDVTLAQPEYGGRERGHPVGCRAGPAYAPNGTFWSNAEWIECHDGKTRRTEPGVPLLAHGIPARVAKWRGFGNAIVPPLAAEVLRALL